MTSWPTPMVTGRRAFFAAGQRWARTGRRRANYSPVLSAVMLPLACGNGTVDGGGGARSVEAMSLWIAMFTRPSGLPHQPVYRPGRV